jgi:MFS transporter, ACS family, hexuronate transporter
MLSAPATTAVTAAPGGSLRLSRYRFVALAVVWSAYLIVFLSRLCVGPLAPFLKSAFDLDNAQIGGLTSATAVAYAPTLIFAGWLVDRIGVRRALLIGTLVTGVCIGAVALAPSYGTMLLLLAASGLGCGFIYPTAVKAIMLWFPPQERATAVGVNQSAVNISGMLGAAIMPALAVAYGWQAGFVFAAALAFVVCGVAVAFYRDPSAAEAAPMAPVAPAAADGLPDRRPAGQATEPHALFAVVEIDQGLPSVTGDERTDRAALTPGFLAVIRSRDILLMGLAALFLGMVEFAALAHLVLFLHSAWGYSVAAAAGLLAFCQFAGALGKPLSGLVSDRLLRRRRVPALLGMGILAGISCVALALVDPGHTWLLWVVLFVLGFGAVGWGGLMGTLAGETGGASAAGAAAGVSAAFFNVGIFFGPPLFGLIVDRTGSYSPAWWTMAASAAVSLVLLAFVRERRRH